MNKRIAQILLFLSVASFSYGQLTLDGWSHNHLNIFTYDGATDADGFTLRFSYTGTNLNEPHWKLSVRPMGPIQSTDGNVLFPTEKISFVPTRTEGQASHPGPIPTVSQIGMPSPVALNGTSEVFLVPSSNAPLYNVSQWSSYYDLRMIFNLVVAGGAYLNQLQKNNFHFTLRFTAYRQDNSVIGVKDIGYRIQVHKLSGVPPVENEYSILVSTEASNGLLEFNTVEDYLNGKSVTYTDGLTVSATTAYQVTVRSTSPHFSSAGGDTLPLDVVRLQLSGGPGTTAPVTLSTTAKTILQGLSSGGASETFDITYSTEANDPRLFNVPSEQYETSLLYEISPQ
ncbi:MAG: hypothetical protein PHT14_08365 [Petrimonas sp.]|nr:hypothetical protein [Petrimonas sp.]